jgi:hydrogenase expression/formation protein HypE
VVAAVAAADAPALLARWQALPEGEHAAIIGETKPGDGRVILTTGLGGQRILQELEDDPLPRIC